jgi:tripartite-type tricarboxylate transporter receptor subunit TctC
MEEAVMAISRAKSLAVAWVGAGVLGSTPGLAGAQDTFPDRPVRLVNPYSPGGSVDLVGRAVARGLTELWGQQIIIDNRPGAGTQIGSEIVARSEPNGYTMLVNSSAIAINPSIYRKMRYDPIKDLYPIAEVSKSSPMLAVNPGLPVKSVKDLVALARAQPGKITCAASGIGSTNHLSAEMFKWLAGVNLLIVPYKGGGPAITDLVAGHVQMFFNSAFQFLPLAKSGRLRILGSGAAQRVDYAPDIPTIAEQGVAGFEASTWYAVYGPGGLPKPLAQKWNDAINKWLQSPQAVDYFKQNYMKRIGGNLDTFAAFHRSEIARWRKVVQAAGLKPQ